jgi:hypothetical protein
MHEHNHLLSTTHFWNNLHHVRSKSQIGKSNDIGNKKIKWTKYDSQAHCLSVLHASIDIQLNVFQAHFTGKQ